VEEGGFSCQLLEEEGEIVRVEALQPGTVVLAVSASHYRLKVRPLLA
jgi:hypothetical protein